jgi:polyferredoxin
MSTVKRKISKIQIARVLVQILGLILLPGTFILAFSEIKDIYLALLLGNLNLYQMIPRIVELIAVIPITIIAGRFFCGWLCAFGTFNDFVYLISKKVFKIKFKVNEKLDSMLKLLKYVILLFIIYFIWTKGSSLFATSSPWDAFAQLPSISDAISEYAIGSIFLLAITIGAVFIERFFCRYLCPLGAVFAIISRLRIFNISKNRDKCGKCRLCTNNCSMGIPMYRHDKIKSGECINCFKCIDACPRKNTKADVLGEHISPSLAASVAIGGFTVLYSGTSFIGNSIPPAPMAQNVQQQVASNTQDSNVNSDKTSNSSVATSNTSTTNNQQQKYKDGTYTGVGRGYRPGLQVSVTIKNGKISDIQIGQNNETQAFGGQAFSVVPNEIIQAQSVQVDGVSGATRSSNGIKQAVEDALSKAQM